MYVAKVQVEENWRKELSHSEDGGTLSCGGSYLATTISPSTHAHSRTVPSPRHTLSHSAGMDRTACPIFPLTNPPRASLSHADEGRWEGSRDGAASAAYPSPHVALDIITLHSQLAWAIGEVVSWGRRERTQFTREPHSLSCELPQLLEEGARGRTSLELAPPPERLELKRVARHRALGLRSLGVAQAPIRLFSLLPQQRGLGPCFTCPHPALCITP